MKLIESSHHHHNAAGSNKTNGFDGDDKTQTLQFHMQSGDHGGKSLEDPFDAGLLTFDVSQLTSMLLLLLLTNLF